MRSPRKPWLAVPTLCLTLVTCAPDPARRVDDVPNPNESGDVDLLARAKELDRRRHAPLADPTWRAAMVAADTYAELAELGRRRDESDAMARLASIADLERDLLLACKRPLWDVTRPLALLEVVDEVEPTRVPGWLESHGQALRIGLEKGYAPSRLSVNRTLDAIDRELARPAARDATLYVHPALRNHRALLESEILPRARTEGIAAQPGGQACFDAMLRQSSGFGWVADSARRVARQRVAELGEHESLSRAEVDRVLERAAAAVADGGLDAELRPVWRPMPATRDGWALHLVSAMAAQNPEWRDRERRVVGTTALWALAEIRLHHDGASYEDVLSEIRKRAPTDAVAHEAMAAAADDVQPVAATAALLGRESVAALRTRLRERLGEEFSEDAFHSAVARVGALPLEMFESEVSLRCETAP